MKIEDIRYSKYLSKNSPGISLEMEEKIDDLTRYLRLSAEFLSLIHISLLSTGWWSSIIPPWWIRWRLWYPP